MGVRGLKRAEAVSISSQLSVCPFESKSEKRIVYICHLLSLVLLLALLDLKMKKVQNKKWNE